MSNTERRKGGRLLLWASAAGMVLAVVWAVFFVVRSRQVIPYINDGEADWSELARVEIFTGGVTGNPAVVLEDKEQIGKLAEEAQNVRKYRKVPAGKWLEGMHDIWVCFDNGVVIGMYRAENYGYIGTKMQAIASGPFYQFPEAFRETVLELLQAQERRVRVFQDGVEIVPYENASFAELHDKKGWWTADRPYVKSFLAEIADSLPVVKAGAEMELRVPQPDEAEFCGIELYNEACEPMMQFDDPQDFEGYCMTLEPGTYYACVSVVQYGDYVKSDDRYERLGKEYVFRME